MVEFDLDPEDISIIQALDFGSPPRTPYNLPGQGDMSAPERLIPAQYFAGAGWDNTSQTAQTAQTFSHEGNDRQRTESPFDRNASSLTPERQRAHPHDVDHQTEELSPSERKRLFNLHRRETERKRRLLLETRNRDFMARRQQHLAYRAQFQPPISALESQVELYDASNTFGPIASQRLWAQRNVQAKVDAANWRDEPDPRKRRNLQLLHGKRERKRRRLAAEKEAERIAWRARHEF